MFYDVPEISDIVKGHVKEFNDSDSVLKEVEASIHKTKKNGSIFSGYKCIEISLSGEEQSAKALDIASMPVEKLSELRKALRDIYDKNLGQYSVLKPEYDRLQAECRQAEHEYDEVLSRRSANIFEERGLELERDRKKANLREKMKMIKSFETGHSFTESKDLMTTSVRWLSEIGLEGNLDLERIGMVYFFEFAYSLGTLLKIKEINTNIVFEIKNYSEDFGQLKVEDRVMFVPANPLESDEGAYLTLQKAANIR